MATVETDDVETYYDQRGDGPAVVFVHGMFLNADQWAPQVAALSGEYRTVAYDVRGHGRTGGSDRDRYSVALFAGDLGALLEALGVERAVVVGLSMGGAVAQAYAAADPGRVAGLVLADTFAAGVRSPGARLAMANVRLLARLDRVVRYTTLNRLQMRVGNLLAPGVAGDADAIQRVTEAEPIPHDELVKVADATAAFPGTDLEYARIEGPVLLLRGEHLLAAMRAMHEPLAERLAHADVSSAVVPGAGHASNLDNPAFFTDAVRGFLGAVYDGRSNDGAAG